MTETIHYAIDRLTTGTRLTAHRIRTRTTTWIARGRRHDLTGWKAALGCILRLAALTAGLYAITRLLRAMPALMWLLTAAWTVTAWRAGRPPTTAPETTTETTPETTAAAPDPAPVVAVLRHLIGDHTGVHLTAVLDFLQEYGGTPGPVPRSVTDVRRSLTALGIPVRRSLKAGGRVTWGVHRDDLPAPSPDGATPPPTEASTAA